MASSSLGLPIAWGRTAELYAWKPGQVLKLFYPERSVAAVEDEARIARLVAATGLAVPAVGDIVEIDARYGLVYERVEGPSMLATLAQKPWRLFHFARLLAELQVALHTHTVPEIRSHRQRLVDSIGSVRTLPAEIKKAVLHILHALPDNDRHLHGDLHPDNILLTAHGPIIIDWTDAASGHPLADVGRTSFLLGMTALHPGVPRRGMIEKARGWFHRAYLHHYFRLNPPGRKQLESWQIVVAAARLNENIPVEQARLIAFVTDEVARIQRDTEGIAPIPSPITRR